MIVEHLRTYVIKPTLEEFNMWSQAAENLLIGTAAQESQMGKYLVQLGGGPALGIYQMEPATHDDIWENYLEYHGSLALKVNDLLIPGLEKESNLIVNLAYQTIMARLIYYRAKETLPSPDDMSALAIYWKRYYNTYEGKGEPDEFCKNYRSFE